VILQIDFLDRTCVTNKGTLPVTFLVDENIVLIKIQKIQVFINVLIISYYLIETYFSMVILN
jgi:hypothetical protein